MILVTGANGYIGCSIVQALVDNDISVLAGVRKKSNRLNKSIRQTIIGHLDGQTDCQKAVKNVSVVIHSAGLAHSFNKNAGSLLEYRKTNVFGTVNLARQAASSGVRRFIFLSSIGVNGNVSSSSFTELDIPNPHNFYAQSKYEAEIELLKFSSKTTMDVVIIRPPLVYGPNPPGNFKTLLNAIKKCYPLPFSSVTDNKRSFVALDNLVDFIILCADYRRTPRAANQVFLISDDEDVSTADLLTRIYHAYGENSKLFPFPVWLMRFIVKLIGKKEFSCRLLDSLRVDISKAKDLLGWSPVITMDKQLKKIAAYDFDKKNRYKKD